MSKGYVTLTVHNGMYNLPRELCWTLELAKVVRTGYRLRHFQPAHLTCLGTVASALCASIVLSDRAFCRLSRLDCRACVPQKLLLSIMLKTQSQ